MSDESLSPREVRIAREAVVRTLRALGHPMGDSGFREFAAAIYPLPSVQASDRMSDYQAGYTCGFSDAKNGDDMRGEVAAALFLGLPVWDVTIYYNDVASTDGDGFATHDAAVVAPTDADAIERAEAALRLAVPSADIVLDRTTVVRAPLTPALRRLAGARG